MEKIAVYIVQELVETPKLPLDLCVEYAKLGFCRPPKCRGGIFGRKNCDSLDWCKGPLKPESPIFHGGNPWFPVKIFPSIQ
jgi:hypothetical protein